jgi:cytoskeletal protein RodZ
MKPMRMLILLAVFWAAGSLLLAAESPSTPKPAPATQTAGQSATTAPAKTDPAKSDGKTGAGQEGQEAAKKGDKEASERSIAEQAEAALKAANEAAGATAKETPKSDDKSAGESQAPANSGKGPSPQRFVPSEQVRADFDVSFPIDI